MSLVNCLLTRVVRVELPLAVRVDSGDLKFSVEEVHAISVRLEDGEVSTIVAADEVKTEVGDNEIKVQV